MVSRGIETLKRIMWRLKEEHDGKEYITKGDVERAIMFESGLDHRTIGNKLKALKTLGWIYCERKCYFINRNADLD